MSEGIPTHDHASRASISESKLHGSGVIAATGLLEGRYSEANQADEDETDRNHDR